MSNARILGNIVVGGTFDTDKLSEGSTNLFYTNARVDAEIDSYLSAGTGITLAGSGSIAVDNSVIATLADPALTGTPTAPTASTGTNTTQIATTAFVKQEIDALKALLYAYEQ
jgi:hypothetical protein